MKKYFTHRLLKLEILKSGYNTLQNKITAKQASIITTFCLLCTSSLRAFSFGTRVFTLYTHLLMLMHKSGRTEKSTLCTLQNGGCQ